jgi:putative transposase
MDLCNRATIAYSTSRSPNLELTDSSLSAAIATLNPGQHLLMYLDQ